MIKAIINSSLWLASGSVIGRAIPVIALFLIGNTLARKEYTSASTAFMWASVASSLIAIGISTVMTQKIAKEPLREHQKSVFFSFYFLLLSASTMLFIACILGGGIALSVFYGNTLNHKIYIPAAIIGWAWPQYVFFIYLFNGLNKNKVAALLVAVGGVCQGLGMCISWCLFHSNGLALAWGLAYGTLIATLIGIGFAFNYLTINASTKSFKVNFELLKVNKYTILASTAASASVIPVGFLAGSLVSKSPNGMKELAEYYRLEQINQFLIYFPAIVGQALMPMLSKKFSLCDNRQKITTFRIVFKLLLLMLCFSTVASIVIGPIVIPIIRFFNIPNLSIDGAWATRWLIYNASLALPLSLLGATIVGAGYFVFGSICNIVWGACVLLFSYKFLMFGNAGFQVARVIASLGVIFIGLLFLYIKSRISLSIGNK